MQIERKLEEIPEEIRSMEERERQLEVDFQDASKEMNDLLVLKKEKDNDIQVIEEEMKKHQKELNSLKSNDAYSAVIKELNTCKEKREAIENEQLEIMEKEDRFIANKGERRKELDEKKAVFIGRKKEFEDEMQRLKELLDEIQNKRNEASKNIEESVFLKYERIRKGKQGIGIVPLEDDSCGGCHIMLTPQEISDVIRGREIVYCNTCSRIVYFDEEKAQQQQK